MPSEWILPLAGVLVIVAGCLAAWILLRRGTQTRFAVMRRVHADPEVAEWVVAFDWTGKVLYIPSLVAAIAAAGVTWAVGHSESMSRVPVAAIGGAWLAIVVLNVLIEEGRFGWKGLTALTGVVLLALLWISASGLSKPLARGLSAIEVNLSAGAYLTIAAVGFVAIAGSWVRGVFTYVVVTPKRVVVGRGPLTKPEELPFDAVTIEIDRHDLLKRLVGFGRAVVSFKDASHPPIVCLTGRIATKVAMLKAVRRQVERDAAIVPARPAE